MSDYIRKPKAPKQGLFEQFCDQFGWEVTDNNQANLNGTSRKNHFWEKIKQAEGKRKEAKGLFLIEPT